MARRSRAGSDPAAGGEDYHNPLAGIGGLPPARSALTLRLILAAFGLLACGAAAGGFAVAGAPNVLVAVLAGLALIALVDLWIIASRMRRERGPPPA